MEKLSILYLDISIIGAYLARGEYMNERGLPRCLDDSEWLGLTKSDKLGIYTCNPTTDISAILEKKRLARNKMRGI
jgi:hypothetical protein